MSLLKQFDTANEDHGGSLFFSGLTGNIPFRGTGVPLLKRDEEDQLKLAKDVKLRQFDLSNQDEAAAYQKVLDRIANNWYTLIHREHHWDADKKIMYVYVEWTQRYVEATPELKARAVGGTHAPRLHTPVAG